MSSKSAKVGFKNGSWWNSFELSRRYKVSPDAVAARVRAYLKKHPKYITMTKRMFGNKMCFHVTVTDKIFGYKDGAVQGDLFANRSDVEEILEGAKRIAANVPTVGGILRKDKPKGDKKVYQPTYDDFFEWCGRTGDYPKKVFDDYVKTSNLGTASQSLIAGRVLCDTLRRIRAEYFDMVKDFLLTAVGKEKPSRADLYRERALRMGFNAMLDPEKGGAK